MKKLKKLHKQTQRTNRAFKTFANDLKKNIMKLNATLKKIWVLSLLIIYSMVTLQSCNVTRVVTNESQYLQRGDTSVVIQTKIIETYDATKKGF